MKNIKLRTKLTLGIILLVLLFGSLIVIMTNILTNKQIRTALEKKSIFIAEHLADESVDFIITNNIIGFRLYIEKYLKQNYQYIYILGQKDEVLMHTFEKGFPIDFKNVNDLKPSERYSIQDIIINNMPLYEVAVPIANGKLGVVHAGFSKRPIQAITTSITHILIGNILLVLAVGIIVVFIFTTRTTKPIGQLIEAVEAISKGDFTKQADVKTHDEIGELAAAFNTMIQHIKKSQEALTESEKRFRQIAENSEEWIWEVNKDGLYTYASPVVEKILGYKPEEILGKKYFYDFFHPRDKEELKNKAFEIFKQREKFSNFLNRNIHNDGRIIWLSTSGIPIFNKAGKLCGYRGVDTDITLRKNTIEKITSISRFSAENPQPILRLNESGEILYLNEAVYKILKKTKLANADMNKILPDNINKLITESLEKNIPIHNIEVNLVDRVYEYSLIPVKENSYVNMYGADITERRNREIELQWHTDTQITINSIFRLSLENTLFDEFLRRALTRILAIPWLFIESKGAIFLIDKDTKDLILKAQHGLPKETLKSYEKVALVGCLCGQTTKTGKIQFVSSLDKQHTKISENITPHSHYCVPIKYANKLIGVLTVHVEEKHIRDKEGEEALMAIADALAGVIMRKRAEDALEIAFFQLKQTQNQLIQAEKMEVVGRLSSGIAHEVKNPLATILTATEYLKILLDNNKEATNTIDEILKAVERADNIIKGLLNFSRISKLEITATNLNSTVHNALILAHNQLAKYKIKLITDYAKDMPDIEADIDKIDQVFINIFMNAVYAMPKGGTLTIKTYTKKLNHRAEGVGLKKNDPFKLGDNVAIAEIHDTGCGIPKDTLNKIFEPFFTTRRTNGGTGLGLSITKNIIEMHGGMIKIENRTDSQGALVTVMFKAKKVRYNKLS